MLLPWLSKVSCTPAPAGPAGPAGPAPTTVPAGEPLCPALRPAWARSSPRCGLRVCRPRPCSSIRGSPRWLASACRHPRCRCPRRDSLRWQPCRSFRVRRLRLVAACLRAWACRGRTHAGLLGPEPGPACLSFRRVLIWLSCSRFCRQCSVRRFHAEEEAQASAP